MMSRELKGILKKFVLGLLWFYLLLWPFMGIKPDGTLEFIPSLKVWGYVSGVAFICLIIYLLRRNESVSNLFAPVGKGIGSVQGGLGKTPKWIIYPLLLAALCVLPFQANRYVLDVAIYVLIYICLGLGLNIVVGLCGLLDLGYIAFYGVGAYTYALLSLHFHLSFWICLPFAGLTAAIAGCIIGYPTLRMRGDYLAIVTLGFGEIVRLILNNWMSLTNGPNGILRIKKPDMYWFSWENGFHLEHFYIKKLPYLYLIALGLTIFTIIAVYRLNHSRIGRAWEAVREDETAAELMGVNTFMLKLMAYGMGAVFGGLAGAFFSARMANIFPTSFTFIESALVLSMVVLGGLASIPGVVLGALALVALPEVFREFAQYRMLAFGAAMTIMMVFRPAGLIPAKRFGSRSEESH